MGFDDFICSIWTLLTVGYFVQIVECTQNRVCYHSLQKPLFTLEAIWGICLQLSRLNDVATKVYNIRTHALPFAVKLRC